MADNSLVRASCARVERAVGEANHKGPQHCGL
jgi:hypothetical protein